MIEGFNWGGQLMITSDVENYPGYPEGVMGPEMMAEFRRQAERFGTEFVTDDVTRSTSRSGRSASGSTATEYRANAVIIATGASARWLGLDGEQHLQGRGVSACATCDGAFFRDKELIVVGGGDTAMEEATFLTRFATQGHASCTAATSSARRRSCSSARATNEKIEFVTNAVDRRDHGRRQGRAASSCATRARRDVGAAGRRRLRRDRPRPEHEALRRPARPRRGRATSSRSRARPRRTSTGVFAAGDVQDHIYRQAITAAGTGCMAALDAERFLAAHEGHEGTALTAPRPEAAEV